MVSCEKAYFSYVSWISFLSTCTAASRRPRLCVLRDTYKLKVGSKLEYPGLCITHYDYFSFALAVVFINHNEIRFEFSYLSEIL